MSVSVAERLAALHAESFDASWDAAAFETLLSQPGVALAETAHGFILIRTVAGEAEILTLTVRPAARRRGVGGDLLARGLVLAAAGGAERLFLEVAEDNVAARALYARAGFAEAGRRRGYYGRTEGPAADALVLALDVGNALP